MAVEVSSALLLNLMRATYLAERNEICGILRGRGDRLLRADRARNVASAPKTSCEIDPAQLDAAFRSAGRKGSLEVLGYYHSRASGETAPSPQDAERAVPDGKLWLVVTRERARLWRAVEHGALLGRFEPVTLDLMIGNQPPKRVDGVVLRGIGEPCDVQIEIPPPGM